MHWQLAHPPFVAIGFVKFLRSADLSHDRAMDDRADPFRLDLGFRGFGFRAKV